MKILKQFINCSNSFALASTMSSVDTLKNTIKVVN